MLRIDWRPVSSWIEIVYIRYHQMVCVLYQFQPRLEQRWQNLPVPCCKTYGQGPAGSGRVASPVTSSAMMKMGCFVFNKSCGAGDFSLIRNTCPKIRAEANSLEFLHQSHHILQFRISLTWPKWVNGWHWMFFNKLTHRPKSVRDANVSSLK